MAINITGTPNHKDFNMVMGGNLENIKKEISI
jgi:hypothetical protein